MGTLKILLYIIICTASSLTSYIHVCFASHYIKTMAKNFISTTKYSRYHFDYNICYIYYVFISSSPHHTPSHWCTEIKKNRNKITKPDNSFTDGNELAEAAAHSLVVTAKKSSRTNEVSRFSHPYPLIVTGGNNSTMKLANTIVNNRYSKSQSLSPPLQQKLQIYPSSFDETNVLSRNRSSSLSCSKPITANGVHHVLQTGEDSSQSSLNLSASSGYLSGSSANSSVGGSNLNLSLGASSNGGGIAGASTTNGNVIANGNGTILNGVHLNGTHHMQQGSQQQQQLPTLPNMAATMGRRRTISSNSNG